MGERKVGGILPEGAVAGGRLHHVVIGVGLNVLQTEADFPPELRSVATSLAMEGYDVGMLELLTALLSGLRTELGPDGRVAEGLLPRYRGICASLGRVVRATVGGGRTIEGTAVDVGPGGELIVETPRGTETIGFGEIVHLGTAVAPS